MIKIENLIFNYGINKVLDDISINIKTSEFVAVLGQNGSGKTTLVKHLNGLLKPNSGFNYNDNKNIENIKTSALSKDIGFLFQNPDHQIFCDTVKKEISFGLKNQGYEEEEINKIVLDVAKSVGLEKYLDKNPFLLGKGLRQRTAFASILAMSPKILVLDEPTTGQDYYEAKELMEMVKELNKNGTTVLVVTHDMELVNEYCKRAIVLKNGKVIMDDAVSSVFRNKGVLKEALLKSPSAIELSMLFNNDNLFNEASTVEDIFNEIMKLKEGQNERVS